MSALSAEKCKKELRLMMKDTNNKHCADCGLYPATWTSCNLGVFICVGCSGIHRSLGVHISFVKSATLDDWNEKLLNRFKEQGGNLAVNKRYEAKLPPHLKINESVHDNPNKKLDLIKFIRNKYEKKLWYKVVKEKKKRKNTKSHRDREEEQIEVKTRSKPKPKKAKMSQSQTAVPEPQTINKVQSQSPPQSAAVSPTFGSMNSGPIDKRESFLSFDEMDDFYVKAQSVEAPEPKKKEEDVTDLLQDFSGLDNTLHHTEDKKKTEAANSILAKYSTPSPAPPSVQQQQQAMYINNMQQQQAYNGYVNNMATNNINVNMNYGQNMQNMQQFQFQQQQHHQHQQQQQFQFQAQQQPAFTTVYGNNLKSNQNNGFNGW